MHYKSKIYVAGHNGLVGSAIIRELKKEGFKKIIKATRVQLDLVDQKKVLNFLVEDNIIYVSDNLGYLYAYNYQTNINYQL